MSTTGVRTGLRLLLGALFVGHGAQKLFGRFGGGGLERTAAEFEAVGLAPGRANAIAAGAAQLGGGAGLLLGLGHPLACTAASASVIAAIPTACAPNGVWAQQGGYEYPLVLAAALTLLAGEGAGPLSLDRLLGFERRGNGVAAVSLATAVGASTVAVALGRAFSARGSAPPPRH